MESTLYVKLNLVCSKKIEHDNKKLALLENGYLLHDDSISHYEVIAVNHQGERTPLQTHEWKSTFEEMFDENGLTV